MGAEISSEMASNGAGDSADSVRIYTTDTIVDHPGDDVSYKGFILIGDTAGLPHAETTRLNEIRRDVVALTQEAKERAKKLDANAIVGVKIMVDGNARYTFTGTAVRFFPK